MESSLVECWLNNKSDVSAFKYVRFVSGAVSEDCMFYRDVISATSSLELIFCHARK